MICADFLAGANLDNGDPATLLFSMIKFYRFLPHNLQKNFLETVGRLFCETDSSEVSTSAS